MHYTYRYIQVYIAMSPAFFAGIG